MDIATIKDLISTVGYPMLVGLLCMWYIHKQSENHKAEIDKVTEALNQNTLAINKMVERMDRSGN